jgi:hypothetical protein
MRLQIWNTKGLFWFFVNGFVRISGFEFIWGSQAVGIGLGICMIDFGVIVRDIIMILFVERFASGIGGEMRWFQCSA